MAHRWVMSTAGSPLQRQELALEEPKASEVIIEVAGCGVCHTDLGYFYDGVRPNHPLPLVLGHEISGHVVKAGAGATQYLGKAVIVPAVIPCGECDACRRGKESICAAQKMPGNDIDGGYGTHARVPATGLCVIDEAKLATSGLKLADLAVVADAVTTPYQAIAQAEVRPGQLAVVIGLGGVGGYCVQILNALGCVVVGLDVDEQKLEALKPYGLHKGINAKTADPKNLKKELLAFCKEKGIAQREWGIFECSGTGAGQATAYSLLVHGATLSVIGFTLDKGEYRLSNLMAFHARAQGNWGCAPRYYPAAVDLVLSGKVALKPFVEHHPLDSVNQVFEGLHSKKLTRRPILIP